MSANDPHQTMRARLTGLEGLALLREVMACLRDPQAGCPWDLQQDFASIAPYTIEEAYEVADAIERNDLSDLKGELGDLLLQVVYHAQLAEEAGAFDLGAVIQAISEKMIRRHPHVFGPNPQDATQSQALKQRGSDGRAVETQDIKANWEAIKASEHKHSQRQDSSILADVGRALPALLRAEKIQKRVVRVGFDWPEMEGIEAKVQEELIELREAQQAADQDAIEDEFGDLLFTLVNWARRMGVSSEEALRRANSKFERRFRLMEQEPGALDDKPLAELEAAWQRAKSKLSGAR